MVELLLKSEHASGYISVLPVVGIGGVGKTTLAQFIYNDPRITEHFQLRIWICVSDTFDVKRITREMVESVSWECRTDLTNLNQLQLLLQEKVMSKRYLLVLDDVWNEDRSKWENLCAPLRFGLQGSKILVTTRSQKVSDIVSATEPMFIKGLSNDSYWSFFKWCAFGCRNSENCPKLEVIGKMIASKLKGLPLAAKTLGGLLNKNLDEEHWRSIMESEIWELQQGENDILPVLKLSYQHLPACLKQCFAYCSLFPKDYHFDKDSLIQMWMAQGFIRPKGTMRMEDVGSDYFNDLLCRSFFQQHSWCKNIFIMHDLLHDLAQYISQDECFRIEDDKSKAIPNTVRHLSICIRKLKLSEVDLSSFKKLRTLIFIYGYGPDPGWVLDDLLNESTSIRVMNLGYLGMTELPDNIGDFKQLRYLDISHTDISKLPESLCTLYNLQFLKLKPYLRVSFPKGMKKLTSLRKLDADEDSVAQITEIGNLTSLQELRLFKVEKEPGHMIKELSNMTELRGSLWISNLENIDNKEEASQAILNNKKYLNELCFKWPSNRNVVLGIDVSYADVLEGLQPHSNIRELKIISYGGVRYPSWLDTITLPNLETIYFANCKSLEQLPSLGRWPFLKFLRFGSMYAVKHVNHLLCGTTKLTGFPVLQKLKCWNMPEWEEWSAADAGQLFPCLRELYIKNCPKLRGLPCIPSSLRKLRLLKVGLNALPGAWIGSDSIITNRVSEGSSTCRSTSLSLLHIKECPNLTSLGKLLLPDCSPYIREICIVNCVELTSLPVERFKDLARLEYLELRDCPKLVQAEGSEFLLPSSLQQLILGPCGNLSESLPGCLQNLTSLSTLKVIRCPHITSLQRESLHHLTALEDLTIKDFAQLRSVDTLQCLASLKSLTILECPRLPADLPQNREPGEGLSSLCSLCIDDTSLITLQLLGGGKSSLQVLKIHGSQQFALFTSERDQEQLQNLRALHELSFIDCASLQSLPPNLLAVSSLQKLRIEDCPEFRSFPENGLPGSLKELVCRNCHPDLKERIRVGIGADWPKIAHIRKRNL